MSTVPRSKGTRPVSSQIAVVDAMHEGVLTCPRDTSLRDVARLMVDRRVHCVVVTDEQEGTDALWGVVSDLDVVAAAGIRDLDEQTAGGTAATEALTLGSHETLQRAAQLMTEHGISHLVVVDGAHRPIGVVSTLDVAAALADNHP